MDKEEGYIRVMRSDEFLRKYSPNPDIEEFLKTWDPLDESRYEPTNDGDSGFVEELMKGLPEIEAINNVKDGEKK